MPRGTSAPLDGHGYLADPEGPFGAQLNPEARTLDALAEMPCVVLLGEPGSGKSHELAAYWKSLRAGTGGDHVLLLDGRSHRDLDRDLGRAGAYRAWCSGDTPLTLLVDSLDEFRIGAHEAGQVIRGHLLNGPLDRLRLRIACRAAEWPVSLDEQLPQMWNKKGEADRVGLYRLAPLRRVDVALAVEQDAEKFLGEVAAREAQPLAMSPVTLRFLVEQFRRTGALPRTRVELYEEGCRVLCEETSTSRRGAKQTGKLKEVERLAIAARIAAVCVLGGRDAVFLEGTVGPAPDGTVAKTDLVGGDEPTLLGRASVAEGAVDEVLGISGLFTAPGEDVAGWVHQTYAEFLAARYLHRRGGDAEGLFRRVFAAKGDRVVPSLREAAAWLASMNKGFLDRLLETQPEILLRSDFAAVGHAELEAIVGGLLARVAGRALPEHVVRGFGPMLARLSHPALCAQLAPYLRDKSNGTPVRRVAIHIAEECGQAGLGGVLADITLDGDEDLEVRTVAARALLEVGAVDSTRRLRPLLSPPAGTDPDDELKGYALRALWKELAPEELFALLTRPQNHRHSGSYEMFLMDLERNLSLWHLPAALAWVANLPRDHEVESAYPEGLRDTSLRLGWEHLSELHVRDAFARAVHRRLRHYDGVFAARSALNPVPDVRADDLRRRLLASALMALPPFDQHHDSGFVHQSIVLATDVSWILEQIQAMSDAGTRRRWAHVLAALVGMNWTAEVLGPIIENFDRVPELPEAMPWLSVREVPLGSAESRWMRREERMARKYCAKYKLKPRPRRKLPNAEKRIRRLLRLAEAGNSAAAWQLHHWLRMDPDGKAHAHQHEGDLEAFPGWARADEEIRGRILAVGKQYLIRNQDTPEEWLGRSVIYFPAAAGYRYLCLIDHLDPAWFDSHPEIWPNWAAIAVAFAPNAEGRAKQLTARAYRAVPDRVLAVFDTLLRQDHDRYDFPFPVYKMEQCWDARLGSFVLNFIRDNDLKPKFMGNLLDALIQHHIEGSIEWATALMSPPPSVEASARLKARAAGHALMAFAPEVGWAALLPSLQSDSAFCREVFLSFVREYDLRHSRNWSAPLSTADAADLYVWLAHEFPHEEDPRDTMRGFAEVTPRHQVAELRDAVLSEIISRAKPEAIAALERIQCELPARDYTWAIHGAKEAAAQSTWVPLTAQEVLALGPRPAPGKSEERSMTNGTAQVDIGIVIALHEEGKELLALVDRREPCGDGTMNSYLFQRGSYRCVLTIVGPMGETEAARVTERQITIFKPACVVNIGISGGIHKDVRVGDVFVPSHVEQYMQDAKSTPTEQGGFAIVPGAPQVEPSYEAYTRASGFELSHEALFDAWRTEAKADLARLLPDEEKRSKLWATDMVRAEAEILTNGHEACGPVVGAAVAFSEWIRRFNRNIKGLDMESFAVLKVARSREPAVAALVIRGISDYGDHRKEQLDAIGGGALRKYATRNAVRFLWALLDAGALPHASPR
ncbi:Hypothetical protein A7982_11619 [Minicystis rosea]|nr:Hypothetical protein A7982_11619 [Minicystis rosea]